MKKCRKYRLAFAVSVLLVLFLAASALAQKWSFAVLSDTRSQYVSLRGVLEQIKSGKPDDSNFPPAKFVLALGDLDPLSMTHMLYNEIMGPAAPLVPVRGNHESPADVRLILQKILPALPVPVQLYDQSGVTFHFDWENARFIILDQYVGHGKYFNKAEFLQWFEKAVTSAENADHIFVFFHEPHVPAEVDSDPFWKVLLKHRKKVRAVFWGHTHSFGRGVIPHTQDGISYVNTGNAGQNNHSDDKLTTVEVAVDGKKVLFRAIQARTGTKDFKVTDLWSVAAPAK